MNSAHLHLILVHLPVILLPLGTILFVLGYWRKNISVRNVGLGLVMLAALFVIPVDLTGDGAEEIVEDLPGIVESTMENHEEMAEKAIWFAAVAGVLSLAFLVIDKVKPAFSVVMSILVILSSLSGTVMLGWTANLGGRIRHPEAYSAAAVQGDAATEHEREGEDKDDDD